MLRHGARKPPPAHPSTLPTTAQGMFSSEGTTLRAKILVFTGRKHSRRLAECLAPQREANPGARTGWTRLHASCPPASAGTRTAPRLSPGLCSTGTGPWGTRPCPRRGRDFGAGFVTVGQLRCRLAMFFFFFIGCFVGEWWQGRPSRSPHRVPSVTCSNRPQRSPNERSGEGWGCAGQMSPPACCWVNVGCREKFGKPKGRRQSSLGAGRGGQSFGVRQQGAAPLPALVSAARRWDVSCPGTRSRYRGGSLSCG